MALENFDGKTTGFWGALAAVALAARAYFTYKFEKTKLLEPISEPINTGGKHMENIQVPFKISKAEKDVLDLTAKIVGDLKAGKGISGVAADLEANLITIVGEAGSLPADFGQSDKYDLGLYAAKAMKDALV